MNKDLLISFLNALLNDRTEEITDVQYLKSEHLGESASDRRAIFDVYCQTAGGGRFIVEMQKAEQAYFKDRSLYYSTFAIREQAVKGRKWDYHLDEVYTVGLLNFMFPGDEYPVDSYRHEIKLKDVEDNHVFYDKLTFVYLEMPKFNKTEDELETMFDKWMFALSNLARLLERPKALQERIFARLFEQAEVARFTNDERNEYVASKKQYWDAYSIATTSYNKGRAKGLAEGEAKGLAKGLAEGDAKRAAERLANARALLGNGVPLEVIVKSLRLTDDEAATLQS
jgi:predicted transposase/invertase (TIGR01784 family)